MSSPPTAAPRGTWLFVVPWDLDHPGGVNQVVLNLYRQCAAEAAFAPRVLIMDWSARVPRRQEAHGCDCIHLRIPAPAPPAALVLKLFAGYCLRLPLVLWRLARLFAQYDVKVVNVHYPTLAVLSLVLLKRSRLWSGRIVLSFHGSDVSQSLAGDAFVRRLWRFMARHCDRLVAVSQSLARQVTMLAGPAAPVCDVIPNGVAQSAWSDDAEAAQTSARPYILAVGTFDRNKAHDVLLQAYVELSSRYPELDLVIIGRAGPTLAPMQEQVRRQGLGDRVRLHANLAHADVIAAMRRCLVFVLPSRSEALGIVILEAGALGKSVVASAVGGVPEVIDAGRTGLLVPPDQPVALAEAIRKLLDDPGLRQRLAGALRADVAARFSWPKAWRSYNPEIPRGG